MKKLSMIFLLLSFFVNTLPAQTTKEKMTWYMQPKKWKVEGQKISIMADPKTDFWQKTHYGYSTDNGHFYFTEYPGDFEATVKVTGIYKDLYDQAGLMIRIDNRNWIKSGIEFVNGNINISAVYTREFSDWSMVSRPDAPSTVWLKLIRKKDSVEVSYSFDGKEYQVQRLGYFPPKVKARIGMMAAAPEGKGFSVTFEDFHVTKL